MANRENRKHTRHSFVEQVTLITLKERSFVSQSENLSLSGQYLVKENPLPPGTRGLLTMNIITGQSKKNISSEFEVIHNHINREGIPGMGIKFIEMSEENKEFIALLIKDSNISET